MNSESRIVLKPMAVVHRCPDGTYPETAEIVEHRKHRCPKCKARVLVVAIDPPVIEPPTIVEDSE